jgi:hypothetical protein
MWQGNLCSPRGGREGGRQHGLEDKGPQCHPYPGRPVASEPLFPCLSDESTALGGFVVIASSVRASSSRL